MAKTEKTVKKATSSLSIPVYGIDGEEKKTIELPKEIFKIPVNQPLIAQSVRVYLANQRKGTSSAKTRSEVAGSTRKIYRQKGTGRARHGDNKAPIFVGGGVVGGPKPKDHSLRMNRNMKRLAFFSSLSLKLKNKQVAGMLDAEFEKVKKTKIISQFLKKLGLNDRKVVMVVPKVRGEEFLKSFRNIKDMKVMEAKSLNTYSVLNNYKLLFTENAVKSLSDYFLKAEK